MGSYNFTYKDVLKRYERIINKPSKFEIRLLATILLIITIVNISSLCFAAEDVLNVEGVPQSTIDVETSTIKTQNNHHVYYSNVQKGHTYTLTISFDYGEDTFLRRSLAYGFTNDVVVGSSVSNITLVNAEYKDNITITFVALDDYFVVVAATGYYETDNFFSSSLFTLSEEMNLHSVSDNLASNVGPSQIWDIFNISINYIWVVVLVAFGVFLVVIAIRKMQKGKSDF